MWYVVSSLGAISTGPKSWNREALSADLAALNVNVRVPLLEPVSPLSITDTSTSESAFVLPQNAVMPSLETWEELTGPVEVVVPGLEVIATYSKQDKAKQDVFDERLDALIALRIAKLDSGVADGTGKFLRLDGSSVARVAVTSANIATGKYVTDPDDVLGFGLYYTDGTFRPLTTFNQAKNTAKKLDDHIQDLDICTNHHRTNLEQLLNDTTSWAGGYEGPGHGVPFTSQDIAEYDFTADPGLCWP